ncbi:PTS system mannose-specific IID component [Elusimicrobium posterum]|uniref:PTS system mannose/fructose/sorbose family transporter subunit IID n=1 Tax=Elusimicrobium posterum TaxID=3116653 RepID=UPI003C7169BF
MEKSDKIKMLLRSSFLQAGWNYLRYQGFGFGFVMLPYLRKLYKGNNLNMIFTRYLETFNTNPVMAAYCYGALAKIETDIRNGKANRMEWTMTKTFLTSSLASIGDRLFWDTLRPLSLVLGLLVLMIFQVVYHPGYLEKEMTDLEGLLAAFVVLVSYNAPVFYAKWKGITLSYKHNKVETFGLLLFDWNGAAKKLKAAGFVLMVFMISFAVYLTAFAMPFGAEFIIVSAFVLFSVFLSSLAYRFNIPCVYVYFLVLIVFCTGVFLI